MNDEGVGRVHWSFWVIGAVALIWNAMGVMNFFVQMSAEGVASMPDSYRTLIESRPAWATGGFAVAVFGGTLGCVLLLLRKFAAYYLFVASLLGAVVLLPHSLSMAAATLGVVAQVLVVAFLIWYAKRTQSKGWIS